MRRQQVLFSASPANEDCQFVLGELAKMPKRERSRALWTWAAGYLRGQAREGEETPVDNEITSAVLDDIADLLGVL